MTDIFPLRYRVHIDRLSPESFSQFIEARKTWVNCLTSNGILDDYRGHFLNQGEEQFWSLLPFNEFDEILQTNMKREKVESGISVEVKKRYYEGDAGLRAHHSEIWTLEKDLTYFNKRIPSIEDAQFIRLIDEEIRPTPIEGEQQYFEAWKQIRTILQSEKYPLSRVTYFSWFGTGHYMSFWLAKDQEAAQGQSLEATLKRILGADEAMLLQKKLDDTVLSRQIADLSNRPDINFRHSV